MILARNANPLCRTYPAIPWDTINLNQFNLVPKIAKGMLQRVGDGLGNISD